MDELINLINSGANDTLFSPLDVITMMGVSALCLFLITKNYQATHRGTSYSQSYIHALFLMGMCTGIVMMIIGSNIARAFSLVGALSIIRFRTAVKDTRDTAYLFFAILVGMGCGTGFYLHTVLFTLIMTGFMWILFRFDYALKTEQEEILKITFNRNTSASAQVESYLKSALKEYRLINRIRDFDGQQDTDVYVVKTNGTLTTEAITDGLSEIEHVTHSALYINDQQVNL